MGGTSVARRPTGPGQSTDDEGHSDIEVAPSEIEVLENQFQESCIITCDDEPLGPCRVLRSLTNGNSVEQLEYAWGVKKGELGPDTRHNEICLRVDLQKTFESGNWALVPHMDVLKEVATRTLLLTQSTKPRPLYTQWFPNQVYNYQFFHFRGAPNVLTRVSDEPGKDFDLFRAPFDKVPVVQAQVHPYFAICDVAQKAYSHQFSSGSGATKLGQVRPDLQDCVDLCAAIFSQWMNVRVPAEAPKPVASSSRDRTISLGGAPLDAQELARQQRRLRKLKEKKLHRVSISKDLPSMGKDLPSMGKDLPPMTIVGDFPPTAPRKKPLSPAESSVQDSPIIPQPQVIQVMEETE